MTFTSEESNRVFYGLGGLTRDIKTIGLAEPFTLTFDLPNADAIEPICLYETHKEYDWVELTVSLEFTADGWIMDGKYSLVKTVNATFRRKFNQGRLTIPPIMGMNRYDTISTNGSQMLARYNTMLNTFGWLPEGELADLTCRIYDKETQRYRERPGFIVIAAFILGEVNEKYVYITAKDGTNTGFHRNLKSEESCEEVGVKEEFSFELTLLDEEPTYDPTNYSDLFN